MPTYIESRNEDGPEKRREKERMGQLEEQVRRLTALRDIDTAIASFFALPVTLKIIIDHALRCLEVDAAAIVLFQADLQRLAYVADGGFRTPSSSRPQFRVGEGLAGQVIVRRQTYHVTNLQNSSEIQKESLFVNEGFDTYIGVPLISRGMIKGVFEIFHRSPLSPTPDWMEFLETLARQTALAIETGQLFEDLQQSNFELALVYETSVEAWSRALDLRERETEGHTHRPYQFGSSPASQSLWRSAGQSKIAKDPIKHALLSM